jgi:hemerythrin-like domain-containing protein
MMPIGPLMKEHRVIEKMIAYLKRESGKIAAGMEVDPLFIDAAVDFIRTYADRTHHGKEEDILFAALAGKGLSPDDRRIMDELTAEHVFARKTVRALVEAKAKFQAGDCDSLRQILDACDALVRLYPDHIRKEDKIFFPAVMRYFDKPEQEAMLAEMARFDQNMIHEKYRKVIKQWA